MDYFTCSLVCHVHMLGLSLGSKTAHDLLYQAQRTSVTFGSLFQEGTICLGKELRRTEEKIGSLLIQGMLGVNTLNQDFLKLHVLVNWLC